MTSSPDNQHSSADVYWMGGKATWVLRLDAQFEIAVRLTIIIIGVHSVQHIPPHSVITADITLTLNRTL